MTTCLATADEDSMLVILSDAGKAAQVSRIGIDCVATGDYLNAALAFGFLVQTGKFVSNSTTTLSETYDY